MRDLWIVGGPAAAYLLGYWLGFRRGNREGRSDERLRNELDLCGQTKSKEVP